MVQTKSFRADRHGDSNIHPLPNSFWWDIRTPDNLPINKESLIKSRIIVIIAYNSGKR